MNPENSIITIDCHYIHEEKVAAYLLIEGSRAIFIENNRTKALPHLLKALNKKGLKPEQVEYLIVTHIHLDHASASAALLKLCPRATLLCHPRARRHLIDPTRLIESTQKVYGPETFRELYGNIESVPEDRICTMEDGESVFLGKRKLTFIHTRGHANHHFCILDEKTGAIFTGDSFGIAYPALQRGNSPFIFPTTSPTDFDPIEARISLQKIEESGARFACLTHFGIFPDMKEGKKQLLHGLHIIEGIMEKYKKETEDSIEKIFKDEIKNYFVHELKKSGISATPADLKLLQMDIELNVMGMIHRRKKLAKSSKKSFRL